MSGTVDSKVVKLQSLFRGHLQRKSELGTQIRQQQIERKERADAGDAPIPSPFLPTPLSVVSEVLTLARVDSSCTVLDIGCGDGRVCTSAALEKGARGIGLESLAEVYEKAILRRTEAKLSPQQVQLYHSDFTQTPNDILDQALDSSNVVFVFLLPSDMARIVDITLESIERKWLKFQQANQLQGDAAVSSTTSSSATPSTSSPVTSCPCPASVRTRLVSWTFSLPSTSSRLALPLAPTTSLSLESAHTKLHLYELCACLLQRGACADEEKHAVSVANAFAAPPASAPAADSDVTKTSANVNISSVPWGHALNSLEMLSARFATALATNDSSQGVFIECDLRIDPKALANNQDNKQPFDIQQVILAHDANKPGVSFPLWFEHIENFKASHHAFILGLKLDFKALAAVGPVLTFLKKHADRVKSILGSQQHHQHAHLLWLNADILPGPDAPPASTPIDAEQFLSLCTSAEAPEAVLSVGWTTGAPSSKESTYTHQQVSQMLELLDKYTQKLNQSNNGKNHRLQFTFPLRASMVQSGWKLGSLQRLLSHQSSSTLTIWTSVADQAQLDAREKEQWLKDHLPKDRTFFDLVL